MSFESAHQPVCAEQASGVALLINSKPKDLGGFSVRRVLPAALQSSVGPFVFFDHIGPAEFPVGTGIDVRPHPHIGLATITYLFTGEIVHRDSLGFVQPIKAGAVNLMCAGRGIVHSERAGEDRGALSQLHGIQSWMALPVSAEEIDPQFIHYPQRDIPELIREEVKVRVIMGSAFGEASPVLTYSPTLYLEVLMPAGTAIVVPHDTDQLAVYAVSGELTVSGCPLPPGSMIVAKAQHELALQAAREARVMIIGGQPLGQRFMWWNFVSSSQQRIEQAKQDWSAGRFAAVPGETEFIPLPER